MAGARFSGGAAIEPSPLAVEDRPLARLRAPSRVYVPMLQHQGTPARPCVGVGQRVARGERIGVALDEYSADVHASCSGVVRVIAARECGHPSGRAVTCIGIDCDGGDDFVTLPPLPGWRQLDRFELAARLQAAGIVGLGGAAFPAAAKLATASLDTHTLIVNGAESDPCAGSDAAVMRLRGDDVVAGAVMLGHVLSARRVVIAVNAALMPALSALHRARAANGDATDIEIVELPAHYPQGSERQLVYTVAGEALGADTLPRDRGVLVFNVATAAAAWRAVAHGEALVSRVVTVAGRGIREACTLEVPLGTPIADLVAAAGGYAEDARRLVAGGAMTGPSLPHDDIPVAKGTYNVLVLSSAELQLDAVDMPCIRCGECARVCPSRLLPQSIVADIRGGDTATAIERGLDDCIECGLCDTVCPSHIPLLHWLRHGMGEATIAASERALADRSRTAHHARNARLAMLAEERSRRLAERERAALANRGPAAPSAAAMPDVLAAALAKARAGLRSDNDNGPSGT